MRCPIGYVAAACAVALPAPASLERATLAIHATPANVEFAGASGERTTVRLPELEFPIRIEPVCPEASAMTSVSINVADTRFRYTPEDFDGENSLETAIVVPAPQIAPLTIELDCPDNVAASVVVSDVLTAQAALRCAGDNGEHVLFEALSLGVELRCPQPAAAAFFRTRP